MPLMFIDPFLIDDYPSLTWVTCRRRQPASQPASPPTAFGRPPPPTTLPTTTRRRVLALCLLTTSPLLGPSSLYTLLPSNLSLSLFPLSLSPPPPRPCGCDRASWFSPPCLSCSTNKPSGAQGVVQQHVTPLPPLPPLTHFVLDNPHLVVQQQAPPFLQQQLA